MSNRSFHINSLYSLFETWGGVARAYLMSEMTTGGMHDFYNNYLGLPWLGHAITVQPQHLKVVQAGSPPYRRGELPIAPKLLLMTVDVQKMHFYWLVRAWTRGKVSYLIDFGRCMTWEDLNEVFERKYTFGGESFGVWKAMIDSGYMTKDVGGVYEACKRSAGRWFPSMGRGRQDMTAPIRERKIDGVPLVMLYYADDIFKTELYERRIKQREGPGWFLPSNLTPEYFDQLTAEALEEHKLSSGDTELVWRKTKNNHYGDVEKMQLVLSDTPGVTRFLNAEPNQEENEPAPIASPQWNLDR